MNSEKRNGRTSVRALDPPDPVDRWICEGLEPEPARVRRVVRHALQEGALARPAREFGWRVPVAACAVMALVLGFIVLGRHAKGPETSLQTAGRRPAALITNASGTVELVVPPTPVPPFHTPTGEVTGVVEVFNRDGCMAVVLPSGGVRYWIIGGDT